MLNKYRSDITRLWMAHVAANSLPLIRTRLSQALNGLSNVNTLYGTVDVLTSTHIIVIRELAQWAEGLGMLQAFSTEFPIKQRHLHLFNTDRDNAFLTKIIMLTNHLAITLTLEQ